MEKELIILSSCSYSHKQSTECVFGGDTKAIPYNPLCFLLKSIFLPAEFFPELCPSVTEDKAKLHSDADNGKHINENETSASVAGCICTVVWQKVMKVEKSGCFHPTPNKCAPPLWYEGSVVIIIHYTAAIGANFPFFPLFLVTLSSLADEVTCQDDAGNVTEALTASYPGRKINKCTRYKTFKSGAFAIVKWEKN